MDLTPMQELHRCLDALNRLAGQMETMECGEELEHLIRTAVEILGQQQLFLQQRLDELTTLTGVAEILTSSLALPEVLQRIVETTTHVLKAKASTLRLLEEDGELRLQAVHNLSQRYLTKGPVTAQSSQLQYRAMEGETVYVEDLEKDARSQYPREAAQEGLHSLLCTGLRVRGRAIGTMSIYTADTHTFSQDEVRLFEALGNQAALAIEQARLHARELHARELERELEIAGQIQMNLIPDQAPSFPHLDVAAHIVPYRDVSGDFYDFLSLPDDNLGFVIADVSGKSVPGALLMAEARAVLRTQVEHEHTVRGVVTNVNRFVAKDTRITEFITLFYGVINAQTRVLTYTNAGHVPPMLFRGDEILYLEEGGIILGFQPDASYTESQIRLHPGDLIVCVTDGAIEGFSVQGEMFGQRELERVVLEHKHETAQQITEQVYRAVNEFTDRQIADDFTILVVKVTD